jgi:hypothetical protein
VPAYAIRSILLVPREGGENLIAGVTGHRDVKVGDRTFVQDALTRLVESLPIDSGLTSLAKGTDQLFARILRARRIPYTAVIPSSGYEDSFAPCELYIYRELLSAATGVVRMSHRAPSERAFMDAGKYIVEHCEALIAVWDGLPARGLGGTADVVHLAQKRHRRLLIINPSTRCIDNGD